MLLRSLSFGNTDPMVLPLSPMVTNNIALEQSLSFKAWEIKQNKLQKSVSFKTCDVSCDQYGSVGLACAEGSSISPVKSPNCSPKLFCHKSSREDAAATKLQKYYRGYRTRRKLADCAVVVEELWWKALDFASLKRSSVSFFHVRETESALSRWARALTRAAKVGKGLSKNDKAQKLALRHWLEAIDPRHRYGHNLHLYYRVWSSSESTQPFFYWLDIGEGKELNLEECPRYRLQHQCVQYLGPKERKIYEVVVRNGKLVYKKSDLLVHTTDDSKWIFVLCTTRNLYVGKKEKGKFQHSSFLCGGAATAAGRLVVKCGILMAIWPYSGHYRTTEENFKEFISFLKENNVDLNHVKRGCVNDNEDMIPTTYYKEIIAGSPSGFDKLEVANCGRVWMDNSTKASSCMHPENIAGHSHAIVQSPQCRWSTGAGARIGCVRDYHVDLQFKALEQVNLSPRPPPPSNNKVPIPSPRPYSGLMLSPRIASCMGVPSPTLSPGFGKMVIPIPTVSLDLPPLKKRASQKLL